MSDLNIYSIFQGLATALLSDNNIKSFIESKYGEGESLTVLIGRDPEDLLDMPKICAVSLIPGSRSRTRGDAYRQHSFSAVCFVYDETVIATDDLKQLEALSTLDTFTNLVESVVFNYLRNIVAVTPSAGEADLVAFPGARSELAYIIEIPSRIY